MHRLLSKLRIWLQRHKQNCLTSEMQVPQRGKRTHVIVVIWRKTASNGRVLPEATYKTCLHSVDTRPEACAQRWNPEAAATAPRHCVAHCS